MNTIFPFGLPAATAFYLVLYLVTFVMHMVFMHYVLAGSTYLAVGRLMGRARCASCGWQAILVDWLPFATGLAITAGVAPLLFVQMLYGREFATANLLLSHRWMAILPVLIVCFYFLYLQKSSWIARRAWAWRPVVAAVAFAGFLFIAWSWTENHLLMLDRQAWPVLYEAGALWYESPGVLPRLGIWFFLAFPSLAIELAWQGRLLGMPLDAPATPDASNCSRVGVWSIFRLKDPTIQTRVIRKHGPDPLKSRQNVDSGCERLPDAIVAGLSPVRRLALTAWAGLAGTTLSAVAYWPTISEAAQAAVMGPLAGPWLAVLVGAVALQAAVWIITAIRDRLTFPLLIAATSAWLVGLVSVAVVREAIRLAAVDVGTAAEFHTEAMQIGGLPVFLLFAALNAAAIVWCIHTVRATMGSEASD